MLRKENKLSKVALKVLAGSEPTPEPFFGGDWPWCMGIIYQPKHPLLMENEQGTEKAE